MRALRVTGKMSLAILFVAGLPAVASGEGGSGIYGRAAWRGELVPGISVFAYAGTGDFLSGEAVPAVRTATDGTYRLPLPPGRYTLVARGTRPGDTGRPLPGDYFCYYSGSPVTVREDEWTPVGFNLVRFAPEERRRGERSAVEGTVTYREEPLEKLYVYLYRDTSDGFRGPGIATYPVGTGGRFRISAPPGRYFLVARKRAKGGMYGPVEVGDHFNYYPGNPVILGENEVLKVRLETVTRVSQLEEEGVRMPPSVKGRVVDGKERGVAEVRVFAYPAGDERGRPLAFSAPSASDGGFILELSQEGDYVLVARQKFGGPAAKGELHGDFRGGEAVAVGDDGITGVVIPVEREP